jgi:predicted proteasome-type protease
MRASIISSFKKMHSWEIPGERVITIMTAGNLATTQAVIIVGGQIAPAKPTMFLIYPEGNFIEASDDTPFIQIGETKYGRPIIVRAFDPDMSFEDALKLLMVSFDSTLKANLSVGLPLDYQTNTVDSYRLGTSGRVDQDDPYFIEISTGWGDARPGIRCAEPLLLGRAGRAGAVVSRWFATTHEPPDRSCASMNAFPSGS